MSAGRRWRDAAYLVGHWSLNSHADDKSGYGNNGTWAGTEAYADGPFGKMVGDFNGSSYVDLSASISSFSSLATGSLSVWFLLSAVAGEHVFVAASDSGDGSSELAFKLTTGTVVNYTIREAGGSVIALSGPTTRDDGAWHHAVVATDSTGTRLHVDGNEVASSATQAFFSSVNDIDFMSIGANKDSGGAQWQCSGDLANARIYNIALTGDEIADMFNKTQL